MKTSTLRKLAVQVPFLDSLLTRQKAFSSGSKRRRLMLEMMEDRRLMVADLSPALFFPGQSEAIVVSTVAGTSTSATAFLTTDTIFVDFGWANFGDTSTINPYNTRLTLDGNLISNPSSGPHESFSGSFLNDVNLGQLSAGVHVLQMVIDIDNVVPELNENNNVDTRSFTVTLPGTDDFGDAPSASQSGFAASYPTLLADGGARHGVLAGFQLGVNKDIEADGSPDLLARGDDSSGTGADDEDGVTFNGAFVIGRAGTFNVQVTNSAGVANPFLDAWVDFNRDGDWSDAGERVFSQTVTAGNLAVNFPVPSGTQEGDSFARFRLHNGTSTLTTGGSVANGEVEDYRIRFTTLGNWVDQGPAGTINGQVQNVTPDRRVSGATHVVVAHPTDADTLYIGAVNGGIWKTTNATDTNPTWTTNSDQLSSLSINALAFDKTDPTHNTLVAGTGNLGSFGGISGNLGLIYRTTDGGNTWVDPGSNGLKSFGGENITSIAARGNTIVASSHSPGGLFRSTNGGANYTAISSGGLAQFDRIHDLVLDESDPTGQRLYAAVEDEAIYRSNDFGVNWTAVTSNVLNSEMHALLTTTANNNIEIAVHPTTGRVFVAILISGQPRGIFFSDNASTATPSWTRMDVPILPTGQGAALTDATNSSPIVITSAAHGLTNNQFVAISGVAGNTAANGVFQISVINTNSFSLIGSVGNGAYAGGGSWARVVNPNPSTKDVDAGSQGRIHFSIAVDPVNDDIIYVGGDRQEQPNAIGDQVFGGAIFRGDASIAPNPNVVPSPQWDHITHNSVAFDPSGGTANGTAPHADSRELTFDANGDLIETDDGGVYRRTSPGDNTGDWFSLNGNLGVVEAHDVAYDSNSDALFIGTQDNGTHFSVGDTALTWDFFSGGDGGDVEVDNITLAASGRSVRYSSSQNLGTFRRSTWDANGALISAATPARTVVSGVAFSPAFRTPIELNAINPTRLILQGSNVTYESLNQGDTISQVSTGFGNGGNISQNAIAYGGRRLGVDNQDVLWVGGGSSVAVRQSGTGFVTATAALPAGASTVRDLTIDPDDWGSAFAVDNNQVFATTNIGVNWSDVTGNLLTLANTLYSVIYVTAATTDALLVGTNAGIFAAASTALGTWLKVGSGMPNALSFDLDYNRTDDVIVSGTLGRGVWKLDAVSKVIDALFTPAQLEIDTESPTGVSRTNGWQSSSSVPGFQGANYIYANARTNAATTFTPTITEPGQYEVFVNYSSHPNRATNSLHRVVHSEGVFSARVNQRIGGGTLRSLGVFNFAAGTSGQVIVSAVGADGFVTADAVQFVRVGNTAAVPSANLVSPAGGTSVTATSLNGDGFIDVMFEPTANLNTGSILDAAPEFTLSGVGLNDVIVNGAPTLVAGSTYRYTFTGTFFPGDVTVEFIGGAFTNTTATLNLSETETFNVNDGVIRIALDNPDAVQNGPWASSGAIPGYVGSDYLYAFAGGRGVLTYTPNIPSDGSYEVLVNYTAAGNRASNAPFQVNSLAGRTLVRVNQKTGGGVFQSLGTYDFAAGSSGSLTLRALGANGVVVGDAVRFVRVGNQVGSPTATLVSPVDGGTIVVTTINGRDFIDVTFNAPSSTLNLGTITDPELEFTLSGPGAAGVTVDGAGTSVGGNTYRYATSGDFSAGAVDAVFGAGTFADNGGRMNIDTLSRFDVLDDFSVDVIVDNTDAGFVLSNPGQFLTSSSVAGFLGANYRAARSGIDETATWTPNLPQVGTYEVFVRYTAHPLRATNATYVVTHDGGTSTIVIDQTTRGGVWVSLGSFAFNTVAASVQLRTLGANSFIVADAVRFAM